MIWWAGDRIWNGQTRGLPARLVLSLTDRLRALSTNRGRNPFLQFGQLRSIR